MGGQPAEAEAESAAATAAAAVAGERDTTSSSVVCIRIRSPPALHDTQYMHHSEPARRSAGVRLASRTGPSHLLPITRSLCWANFVLLLHLSFSLLVFARYAACARRERILLTVAYVA